MVMSFEAAVGKGFRLIHDFHQPVEQSLWVDVDHLTKYGWAVDFEDNRNAAPRPEEAHKIAMYQDLGISLLRADNTKVKWMHKYASEPWGRQGPRFEATEGHYNCICNPKAIIALDSESPDHMGLDNDIHGRDVVSLKHWSDIVFLQWKRYCQSKRIPLSNLQYIMQVNITNTTTQTIVDEALAGLGLRLQPWVGPHGVTTVPYDTPEGQAILATPNGVGPVHLLTQHKRALGHLMIYAITAFNAQTFGGSTAPLNLCFWLCEGPTTG